MFYICTQLSLLLIKNIKIMGAITLTVNSYNNTNITPYSGVFIVEKMNNIRANQNKTTAVTIADSDASTITNAWKLYGDFVENQVFYYSLTTATEISATTRRVRLYSNVAMTHLVAEGTATIADNNAGTIFFSQVQESGISGSVLITLTGALVDEYGDTLTLSNVTQSTNLQLDGESQFMYQEGKERLIKVTVAETPTEIQTLIDAIYS